jgi:hypothetical protein
MAAIKLPEVKFEENKGSKEHPFEFLAKDWAMLSLISGTVKLRAVYRLSSAWNCLDWRA